MTSRPRRRSRTRPARLSRTNLERHADNLRSISDGCLRYVALYGTEQQVRSARVDLMRNDRRWLLERALADELVDIDEEKLERARLSFLEARARERCLASFRILEGRAGYVGDGSAGAPTEVYSGLTEFPPLSTPPPTTSWIMTDYPSTPRRQRFWISVESSDSLRLSWLDDVISDAVSVRVVVCDSDGEPIGTVTRFGGLSRLERTPSPRVCDPSGSEHAGPGVSDLAKSEGGCDEDHHDVVDSLSSKSNSLLPLSTSPDFYSPQPEPFFEELCFDGLMKIPTDPTVDRAWTQAVDSGPSRPVSEPMLVPTSPGVSDSEWSQAVDSGPSRPFAEPTLVLTQLVLAQLGPAVSSTVASCPSMPSAGVSAERSEAPLPTVPTVQPGPLAGHHIAPPRPFKSLLASRMQLSHMQGRQGTYLAVQMASQMAGPVACSDAQEVAQSQEEASNLPKAKGIPRAFSPPPLVPTPTCEAITKEMQRNYDSPRLKVCKPFFPMTFLFLCC